MANVGSEPNFENFDDKSIFKTYETAMLDLKTKNVVIDFNSEDAFAVRDIDSDFMKTILESKVRPNQSRNLSYLKEIHLN